MPISGLIRKRRIQICGRVAVNAFLMFLLALPAANAQQKREGILGGLQGDGWSKPVAPAQPLSAPNRVDNGSDAAIGLVGNYYVETRGIAGLRGMYVSMSKGGKYETGGPKGFYRWVREPDAEWFLRNYAATESGARIGGQFDGVGTKGYHGNLKVYPEGRFSFQEPLDSDLPRTKNHTRPNYGHYQFRVSPSGKNFNRLTGSWKDVDGNSGPMRWRRLTPTIKQVAIPVVANADGQAGKAHAYGAEPPVFVLRADQMDVFKPDTFHTARGNRPVLVFEIYGDEMWGEHVVWIDPATDIEVTYKGAQPIVSKNADGKSVTTGARVTFSLWPDVKEGLHTFHFDGQPVAFNIKKAWNEKSEIQQVKLKEIIVTDLAGREQDALTEGQPFQIVATYKKENPAKVVVATIPADEALGNKELKIQLTRSDNKAVFKSHVLRVERAHHDKADTLRRIVGDKYDEAASREAVSAHFEGEWDIRHYVGEAKPETGKAKIFQSGNRLLALIGEGAAATVYESVSLYGEVQAEERNRLRGILEERPYLTKQYHEKGTTDGIGLGGILSIDIARTGLPVMLENKDTSAAIDWRPDGLRLVQLVLVTRQQLRELIGSWHLRRGGEVLQEARQHWLPSDRIAINTTTLLDDQLALRKEDALVTSKDNNYVYPFKANGVRSIGADVRHLVILGKNLPPADTAIIKSADDNISYEILPMTPAILAGYRVAAHSLAGTKPILNEEAMLVRATLKKGIRPGAKSFTINDAAARWVLAFRDQQGNIRFLREGALPVDPEEKVFYDGETIRLGLRGLQDDFPIDGLELKLEAVSLAQEDINKPEIRRDLGEVTLSKTEDTHPGHNVALSDPHLLIVKRELGEVVAEKDETAILLNEGERLVARPVDPLGLFAVPPGAVATVLSGPAKGALWRSALYTIAKCESVSGDPRANDFEAISSTAFSRTILMDWLSTRKVTARNGDHAALVLIRDELVALVLQENEKLLPYIEASNPQRMAMRYLSEAKNQPGARESAFWKYRKGAYQRHGGEEGKGIVRFSLAEAFDLPVLAKKLGIKKKVDAQDIANREIAKQLKVQYGDTVKAAARAKNANCNIEELLVVAGQESKKVVAKLLPELMFKEGDRWRPDNTARGYVKSAHILGSDARALNELSKIDDAYKAMAIALVAAPVAAFGAGVGAAASAGGWASYAGSTAASLALAADLTDLAYFGSKGVASYLGAEEDYFTALGLSPVLGAKVVSDAKAGRESALMAAVGLIAPGVGALGALKGLKQLKNIEKGRQLVRANGGLKGFDGLDEAQRLDVAAYYKHLKDADGSKFSGMFAREKADMAMLDDLVRSAGGAPPTSNASKLASQLDEGGASSTLGVGQEIPSRFTANTESFANTKGMDGQNPGAGGASNTLGVGQEMPSRFSENTESFANTKGLEGPRGSKQLPEEGAPDFRELPTLWPDDDIDTMMLSNPNKGAKTSPYSSQLDEIFSREAPTNGKIYGSPDVTGTIPVGTTVVDETTGDVLEFGDRLGKSGGFTKTYRDATDKAFVLKSRHVPLGGKDGAKMEHMIHDSEVGRKLLANAERKDSYFKITARQGNPILVRDPNMPDGKIFITKEANIASEVNGKVVTNAAERFAARGSDPTRAEQLTIQLAIRELNQKGIAWTDSKLTNLDVIPDKLSPTGYKVVYFDYDGFRPMLGNTPRERWLNARVVQRQFDAVTGWGSYGTAVNTTDGLMDFRAFGREMFSPTSHGKYKTGVMYDELNELDPDAFRQTLDQLSTETGKPIVYSPTPFGGAP